MKLFIYKKKDFANFPQTTSIRSNNNFLKTTRNESFFLIRKNEKAYTLQRQRKRTPSEQ